MSALDVRRAPISVAHAPTIRLLPYLAPVQVGDIVHFTSGQLAGKNATVTHTSIPSASRPALIVQLWETGRHHVTVREHIARKRANGTGPDYARRKAVRHA